MAKIAILGFGTVGSGVYEVLCRNAAGVSRRAGEPVAFIVCLRSRGMIIPISTVTGYEIPGSSMYGLSAGYKF